MAVKITKGDVDNRVAVQNLTNNIKGSYCGYKGYISKELFKICSRFKVGNKY